MTDYPIPEVQLANPATGTTLQWLLRYYLVTIGVVFFVLALVPPAGYLYLAATAPEPPNLRQYWQEAASESVVRSAHGITLATFVHERRILTPWDQLPNKLINAFLAAEDRSFFSHSGVDWRGVARAAWANLKAGGVRQGGSTITQQVAKAYLSPERTIQRKLKELVLARRIEARFGKKEILLLYLNHIFMGSHSYGVAAAAQTYFGKNLGELTLSESAMLAGLARAPSRYAPNTHPEAAKRRRDIVLGAMHQAGYISADELQHAIDEPLVVKQDDFFDAMRWLAPHFTEHLRRDLISRYSEEKVYRAGWTIDTTVDLTTQQIATQQAWTSVRELDKRQGFRGPFFRVKTPQRRQQFLKRVAALYDLTALDPTRPYPAVIDHVSNGRALGVIGRRSIEIPLSLMQWAAPYSRTNAENEQLITDAQQALHSGDVVWVSAPPKWLRRSTWGSATEAVTTVALDQIPRIEGAIYTYDHQSGYTMTMVGGLDYDRSHFNRATQACRQPGSVYKPVFFSLAMDRDDYSMATILHDKPYEPEPGESWNPQNIHGTLDGNVTLHNALVRSLNLPAIQLVNQLGPKEVAKWARRLGFTTPIIADKALALGASCVRVDELTRAFGTFVRGGSQRDPIYIRQIRDRQGAIVEDHTVAEDPLLNESDRLNRLWATSRNEDHQVIDRRTAFLTTKLLRDSVLLGIAARCQIVPTPTGGKGGTSSDTMDVWFSGFTAQWATTAWIGDDTYQRPLGAKEASYTTVIPMWANYMRDSVGEQRPDRELPLGKPDGLSSMTIDADTGAPAGPDSKPLRIYFRPGSYRTPN